MTDISLPLLDWYDRHARSLPWRTPPYERASGAKPDPYHVWLSEIMLQQTTVIVVRDYFDRFISNWPRIEDLARAEDADVMAAWAGLGYYARARNLLKCARKIAAGGEGFPEQEAELLALPGIGPYTAAAISAIAFGKRANVVDGNVERVISRVDAITGELPKSRSEIRRAADKHTPDHRAGDYAQALMDLGSTICTPRSPRCGACPISDQCVGRATGIQDTLPRKAPKPRKPTRRGIAWVGLTKDGAWLLETRPQTGLLGGTLGWPGTEWVEGDPSGDPPVACEWTPAGSVRHTFTHFHLELEIRTGIIRAETQIPDHYSLVQSLDPSHLPTVMRKVHDRANNTLS